MPLSPEIPLWRVYSHQRRFSLPMTATKAHTSEVDCRQNDRRGYRCRDIDRQPTQKHNYEMQKNDDALVYSHLVRCAQYLIMPSTTLRSAIRIHTAAQASAASRTGRQAGGWIKRADVSKIILQWVNSIVVMPKNFKHVRSIGANIRSIDSTSCMHPSSNATLTVTGRRRPREGNNEEKTP